MAKAKRLRPSSAKRGNDFAGDGHLRVRLVALARQQAGEMQSGARLPIASPPVAPPETWQETCDDIAAKGKIELSERARDLLWEAVRNYRDYSEDESALPDIVEGRGLLQGIAGSAKKLQEQLKTLDNHALLESLLRSYMWPDPAEHRMNDWTDPAGSLVQRYLHKDLVSSTTLDSNVLPTLLRQLAEACEAMLADVGRPKRGRPGYPAFDAFVSQLTVIYMGSKAVGATTDPWRGKPRADASGTTGRRNSSFVRFCRAAADLVPIRGSAGPSTEAFGKAVADRLRSKGIDRSDGLTRVIARDLVVDKHYELTLLPPNHIKREIGKNDAKAKSSRK